MPPLQSPKAAASRVRPFPPEDSPSSTTDSGSRAAPSEVTSKEKFNLRFFLGLLGVLVLTVCVLSGLHAFQVKRNVQALRRCAERAKEQSRIDRAVKFMALYLSHRPTDIEARIEYATLLEGLARTPQERKQLLPVLADILAQAPELEDIRRRLIDVAIETHQVNEAIAHLEILRQAHPEDADLEDRLADCHVVKQNDRTAVELYKMCVSHQPDRIEASIKLARLLRNRFRKAREADAYLEKMIVSNKKSFTAYLARARYRQEFGMLADAEKDVAEALSTAPDEPQVLLLAAQLAAGHPEGIDIARGHLQHILKQQPRERRAYQSLAALELDAEHPPEAINWLRRGLEYLPDDVSLLWDLAHLLIQTGELREARELIARIGKRVLPPGRMQFLEAAIGVLEGKWREASKMLEAIRPLFIDQRPFLIQTDLLLARCHEKLGNSSRALLTYRRIIARDPFHLAARYGIVHTLLEQGRLDTALTECRQLMELPRHPAAGWALLARLLLLENLRRPPAQQQWEEIERTLEHAAEATPGSEEVTILRAEVLVARKKVSRARQLLEHARDRVPKSIAYRIALADLAEREGQPKAALHLLEEAAATVGDPVELRLARARVLTTQGGPDALHALAQLAKSAGQFPTSEQARLLQGLAAAYHQLGKNKEARSLLGRVAALLPTDLSIRLLLFDLAYREDDEPDMRKALNAIQQIEGPAGPLTRYNTARMLIRAAKNGDRKQLGEARRLLTEVGRERSQWSRVPLALAEIDELERNGDAAIENYQQAVELGERQLAVVRRLVELLFERRRYPEADLVLRKLPARTPAFGNLHRIAAQVALQIRDTDRALEHARKAVSRDSKDPGEQRWLGQILWAIGRLDDAEAAFRRSVELADREPDNWVALILHLARTGQTAKAEAAFKSMQGKLDKRGAELALAQCCVAVNRLDQARDYYRAARAAKPNDVNVLQNCAEFSLRLGEFADAAASLRQIIALENATAAKRARTLLPVVLAAQGNAQKSREALALMGVLKEDDPLPAQEGATVEELRGRAVVLATLPSRKRQKEAISLLNLMDQRQPLSAEDQFLLIQLYENLGEKHKARDRFQRLLAREGDNPRYVAYRVRTLLKRGLTNDAEKWLQVLEQAVPKAWGTIELKARLLAAQGRSDESIALLKKTVSSKSPQVRLAVAGLLEELGRGAAAGEYYRQYAAQARESDRVLVLARYLGRQGRIEEALRLCEQAEQTCPPESVGYASLAVLHAGRATDEHCSRVKARLENARRRFPKASGILICLADLADLQGEYQLAERLYRDALAAVPRNGEALNNLAWQLAVRGGRGEEALRLSNVALDVLGPLPEVIDTRALALLSRGEAGQAVKDLLDAILPSTDRKTLASIQFHLAQAYWTSGKKQEAALAFKEAKQLGINAASLHPLEKPIWEKLKTEFE